MNRLATAFRSQHQRYLQEAGLRSRLVTASKPLFADHNYEGSVSNLSDGSPSTTGVDGSYAGGWDQENGRPQGQGVMKWSNGITYDGLWKDGRYNGFGTKSYSKGGGYAGFWKDGQRHGHGTSYYGGKWGYERWEGPFEDDKAHGTGTMYLDGGGEKPFAFVRGEPETRE